MTKCGIIAIAGEPNAGKSTLINRLVGSKISIVTPKAQTTRFNVRGVCVEGEAQMVFVDTPGIFSADKQFEKAMVRAAFSGIGDADAVLFMLDARKGLKDGTVQLIEKLKKNYEKPIFLALNKIDGFDKTKLLELAKQCDAFGMFKQIFMISALKGSGVEDIKKHLAEAMPEGAWLYPEDQMSDIPLRLLAAEVTREKIFLKLGQELPYAAFVETEAWEEMGGLVKISQVIVVQREGQKKIVIGDKGAMIKAIGMASRKELEKLLEKRVHLALFVKVRAGWKDDIESYRALGLEYRK